MEKPRTSVSATALLSRRKSVKIKLSPEQQRSDFQDQLRRMYWCEQTLAALLPNMAKLATSYELSSGILAHLAVTENQIIRLIHIFDVIEERVSGMKCDVIDAIVSSEMISKMEPGFYRDSAIIECSQQIMEFEMQRYGHLHRAANVLKEELAAEFLATAIKEELNAHRTMSEISLSEIYFDAAS